MSSPKHQYGRLLGPARLKPSRPGFERRPAEDALSDKMRIVSCSAFHRLHGKAQVFSLARTGTVRTRLTHSMEVGVYGQLVAEGIVEELIKMDHLAPEHVLPFFQTVENACLLHDIGNPPFGHMGEYAIREWFRGASGQKLREAWIGSGRLNGSEVDRELKAFRAFDGNPQGLRVVTRLQWFNSEWGLNLTCATLASFCKYLGDKVDDAPFRKKLGFFPSEAHLVADVWKKLGLRVDEHGVPAQRHPLAFIMEAGDDIAYCLSDIEDAIEKGVVDEHQFLEAAAASKELGPLVANAQKLAIEDGDRLRKNGRYHHFRVLLSRDLVREAIKAYLNSEDVILAGKCTGSLLGMGFGYDASEIVREFAGKFIYTSRESVETTVGGLRAITSILDAYLPVLVMPSKEFQTLESASDGERFKKFPVETQLHSLLPERHRMAYRWHVSQREALEPVYRTRLLIDYLSGMTDTHALKMYNTINGTQPIGIE